MLRFHQVSKYFADQLLFESVCWQIDRHQKIGLIGANGTGKSTLLKLCAGELEPDNGYIKMNAVVRTTFLPQLDFGKDSLSGGERQLERLRAAFSQPGDLLLLDEPTNNLDEQAIAWLQAQLQRIDVTLIIVSHDRAFLDSVIDRTVAIDAQRATLVEYGGNYSFYANAKRDQRSRQQRSYSQQQRQAKKLAAAVADLKQKALATENTTVDDFYRGISKRVAGAAKARESRLLRMMGSDNRIEKPQDEPLIRLPALSGGRHTRLLVELSGTCLGYSQPCLSDIRLTIRSGDRIAVKGSNGAGKSLLLRSIIGELEPLSGSIHRASNLTIGYLSQQLDLPAEEQLLSWFMSRLAQVDSLAARWNQCEARTFLHRFLFSGNDVFKRLAQLSGGEVTRLQLAIFIASGAELIVLDEPTNHLDPESVEVLETVLQHYEGALLVATHDKAFAKAIEPELIWMVADGTVSVGLA